MTGHYNPLSRRPHPAPGVTRHPPNAPRARAKAREADWRAPLAATFPAAAAGPRPSVGSALYFAVRLCLRCAPLPDSKFGLRTMSGDDNKRRRGRASSYLSGGVSALLRGRAQPGDELQGTWTREELLRMDDCFVVAVEAAFRSGLESSTSASTVIARPRWRRSPRAGGGSSNDV